MAILHACTKLDSLGPFSLHVRRTMQYIAVSLILKSIVEKRGVKYIDRDQVDELRTAAKFVSYEAI
jgi:hypothetical protein